MIGIYEIKNKINNKVYIGSSNDIERRFNEHKMKLNNKKHHSYKLQKDWDEFGEGAFIFNIIELVDEENLLKDREQYYIDYFDSCNNGYNVSAIADRPDKNYLFDKEKGYLFKNISYYYKGFKLENKLSDIVTDFNDLGRLLVLAEHTYADTNMIAYYKNKKYYPAGIKEISEMIRLCERNAKDFVKRMIDLGIIAKAIINTNEQSKRRYVMLPEELQEEYIQWLKDNGKAEYKLTDVYYNDNGTIRCKKEMAWKFNSSPNDFWEFCKAKNISYDDLKYAVTLLLNKDIGIV